MAELQGNAVISFLKNVDITFYTDFVNFAILLGCTISQSLCILCQHLVFSASV